MQVIDWIDRNEWTDNPPCVHPVLAKLAIRANDSLDDAGRQKLLDLAPRLMGTASDDKMLSVQLAVFCARKVLHIFEEKHPDNNAPRKSIEAAEAWILDPSEENRQRAIEARKQTYAAAAVYASASASAYAATAATYATYAAYAATYATYAADAAASADAADAATAATAADAADLLIEVLGEYDRITDRNNVCPVDLTPAAVAMAGSAVAGRNL